MANQHIIEECSRLMNPHSHEDEIVSYKAIVDVGFKIIYDLQKRNNNIFEDDAFLLFQMNFLKALSLLELINGVEYKCDIEKEMNLKKSIDAFSMWTLVRAQFEAVCNFNNIYVRPTTDDEKQLIYNLWVISGLKYRQRFDSFATSPENVKKMQDEEQLITDLEKEVRDNSVFIILDSDEQKKIETALKKKDFQVFIDEGKVSTAVPWIKLLENMHVNMGMFDQMYTALSLDTHPSNVSVFQFRNTFRAGHHITSGFHALQVSKILLAFMIRDLAEFFPSIKIIFNGFPEVHQLLVNFYNESFRGEQLL